MKTPHQVIAHGQKIKWPAPRWFMDARCGHGSGFGLINAERTTEWTFRDGKPGLATTSFRILVFVACDRRAPKRIKTARHLATFFQN